MIDFLIFFDSSWDCAYVGAANSVTDGLSSVLVPKEQRGACGQGWEEGK